MREITAYQSCGICMAGLPNQALVVASPPVHFPSFGADMPGPELQMSMFNRITALIEAITAANPYTRLLSMSDRELAARGLSREELTLNYIAGLGAR
jgi:hypothetical protein